VQPPLAFTAAEYAEPTVPLGTEVVWIAMPLEDFAVIVTLYAFCVVLPPQAVTFTVKEEVAAVFGVPVRFSDVVALDALAVMPAGSVPDAIAHLYGVQPPLALIAAEYALPTVSLGREAVSIARPPEVFARIATLYAFCVVPPPHPLTFMAKE
jgi:hypothetical protein